jgi:hypothetical protein
MSSPAASRDTLHAPHARRNGHGASGAGVDTQLETLMDKYVEAVRLQNSLKKQIKQTLREREAEVKRKEEEAKEALRRAQKEKDALKKASALMKERMKDAEIMESDDESEDNDNAESADEDDEWEDYVDGGQSNDNGAQVVNPAGSSKSGCGITEPGALAKEARQGHTSKGEDEERLKALAEANWQEEMDEGQRWHEEWKAKLKAQCMEKAKAQLQAEKAAEEKFRKGGDSLNK